MSDDTPPEWPSERVRKTFVEYFASKGHTFVPSSPAVPHDDPTLMFANAGMNQFKAVFTGQVEDGSALKGLVRAANSQKCIRAGGKHNDLQDVGFDTYHHCFFEMLGSWSFGDYFKEGAIDMCWELLTRVYGIDPERLYASYFAGDEAMGLAADEEARDLWLRFLPPSRVLPFDAGDNFWSMGDTGPCGPCSEVHYDMVGGRDAAALVNRDDPTVIEVWNLVFMQFNREASGEYRPLPARHVDTGMGFERICSVLQGRTSNYDTDIWAGLFEAIRAETGARPYAGRLGADDADGVDMAYRVVADHARTLCVAITDGCQPSSTGRGYVLRRILRRAVRYGKQFLDAKPGFFARLVPAVVEKLAPAFPELRSNARQPDNPAFVAEVLLDEETAFRRTLDKGVRRFAEVADAVAAAGGSQVDGESACVLYDTFGFPLDLTELMARERGLTVDSAGFQRALEERREISRRAGGGDAARRLALGVEQTGELEGARGVPATDDAPKYDWVTGTGDGVETRAEVLALWTGEAFVDSAGAGETVGVVFDRTPFYAEAGGQVYDEGEVLGEDGGECVLSVGGVARFGRYVLHTGAVGAGASLRVGDRVRLRVDYERRQLVAKNHTATHLLNFALRRVLGASVDQKGSLVDAARLRFDFTSKKPVPADKLHRVQEIVQGEIDKQLAVDRLEVALADAQRIRSLRAVFGEKYPDPVRVVCVGGEGVVRRMIESPDDERWDDFSVEFCGGTHLDNSGEAGRFAIVSEEGIAKGVRRVVALTHARAAEAERAARDLVAEVAAAEAAPLDGALLDRMKALRARITEATIPVGARAELEKRTSAIDKSLREVAKQRTAEAVARDSAEAVARAEERKEDAFLVVLAHAVAADKGALSSVVDAVLAVAPDRPVLAASRDADSGRLTLIAHCGGDSSAALPANKWVAAAGAPVGGKGGGKPGRAQGAAKDVDDAGIEAMVRAAEEFARGALA